jgi:hypothetical protein
LTWFKLSERIIAVELRQNTWEISYTFPHSSTITHPNIVQMFLTPSSPMLAKMLRLKCTAKVLKKAVRSRGLFAHDTEDTGRRRTPLQ